MESYPRVLVGTDGSPDADAAVRIAGRVAARLAVALELVTVWKDGSDRDHDWALGVLKDAEATVRALGATDVIVQDVSGNAPEILLDRANAQPESLVVVGSAGLSRATSRLVASTSNRLTHNSDADVLFARDPVPDQWNFVAVATDGSSTSQLAVRRGIGVAVALGATPRLITAAKTEEAGREVLDATFNELGLGALDVEVEREVLHDPQASEGIVLAGWKYELVAIGNRSMSGPARLLGSVANKVTHGLKTNLLLVNTTRT